MATQGQTEGFEANSCAIAFVWRANTDSSSVFSGFDWVFWRLSRFRIRQRSKIYTHVGKKGNFWFSHVNLQWIILAQFKLRVLRWLTSCWVALQWYGFCDWFGKRALLFSTNEKTNQNQSYGSWAHFPKPVADSICLLWIDWIACCVTPVWIAQSNFSCFRSRLIHWNCSIVSLYHAVYLSYLRLRALRLSHYTDSFEHYILRKAFTGIPRPIYLVET